MGRSATASAERGKRSAPKMKGRWTSGAGRAAMIAPSAVPATRSRARRTVLPRSGCKMITTVTVIQTERRTCRACPRAPAVATAKPIRAAWRTRGEWSASWSRRGQLGYLPAQREPDARPLRFGGEERHEQVPRIRDPWPLVSHRHLHLRCAGAPRNHHSAARLQRGVRGIADQIDEQLIELIRVRLDVHLRAGRHTDRDAFLQGRDTP